MLSIIGSGLSRTGTMSMKLALESLGFGPCFHAAELPSRSDHIKAFYEKMCLGKPVDWHALFKDFVASMDAPSCFHYQELAAAFPDAKIIHTERDEGQWYDSTYQTIYQMTASIANRLSRSSDDGDRLLGLMNYYWDEMFEGQFQDRDRAIETYRAYNAKVAKVIPPHRLLVFRVEQGWGPICSFLGVDKPQSSFPKANSRKQLRRLGIWPARPTMGSG